eukprot:NODE_46_length_27655_cov_0.671796.p1 type:complete len:942 gc:universal NODE_46_length_27655_cov_0.671796:19242-16417(-)
MSKKAVYTSDEKRPGVDDMTLLTSINNDEIIKNLQVRYQNGFIYCYIGFVLIAVNPFRDPGIYTPDILNSYRGRIRIEMAPHVYAIAEYMYRQMIQFKANQCSIISGESGAGKTENAKRILQYVAEVSIKNANDTKMNHLKDMILATNPLLEAFGNAKTLRNNNSSRFGKYLSILFDSHGLPIGSTITNYLLEKNRVVSQSKDERNFHIFYQFCKGCTPQMRQEMGISGPECYVYTMTTTDIVNVNDTEDYALVVDAMNIIGISKTDQYNVHRILATILWIGNCSYTENEKGEAIIADASPLQSVAYLLQVNIEALTLALTTKFMTTSGRSSFYYSPLNVVQATAVRDALSMSLYSRLFDWIVAQLNEKLKSTTTVANTISILDIYGFEIFEHNSFEQLCINYVNEKLQQIFIELTLKSEQDDYLAEGIKWTPIKYFDNKIVCDLIENNGVFAVLNDAIATVHADNDQADKMAIDRLRSINNPHFQHRGNKFIINHYAGDVQYDLTGITDKNKDVLNKDLLTLLNSSTNQLVNQLFAQSSSTISSKRPPTASDLIKNSAQSLIATLKQCEPSYIRCIKPNNNKSPKEYDAKLMLHQTIYLGLLENIKVRRAGFAYRQSFDVFINRFYLLTPRTCQYGSCTWNGNLKEGCRIILMDSGIHEDEWQLGVSKAFIKKPETLFILENMRDKYWHRMAYRIQKQYRLHLKHKVQCVVKIQRFWRLINGYSRDDLKSQGHALVFNHKSRRTLSLLHSRAFHGDYLNLNKTNFAFFNPCLDNPISKLNPAVFSCRVSVLRNRVIRSDKWSVRYLIVTASFLYLIQIKPDHNEMIPVLYKQQDLTGLTGISTSIYADDLICLHFTNQDDLIIDSLFKTEIMTVLTKKCICKSVGIEFVTDKLVGTDKKDKQLFKMKFNYNAQQQGVALKKGIVNVGDGIDKAKGILKLI